MDQRSITKLVYYYLLTAVTNSVTIDSNHCQVFLW